MTPPKPGSAEARVKTTTFGFDFGTASVERITSHRGHVVVAVNTAKERVFIRVTPSGLIRVGTVEKL